MKFHKFLPATTQGRPTGVTNIDYAPIRKELKANPGLWGELPYRLYNHNSAGNFVARIKKGCLGFLPVGAYEAALREGIVYCRYIGKEEN